LWKIEDIVENGQSKDRVDSPGQNNWYLRTKYFVYTLSQISRDDSLFILLGLDF